MSGTENRYGEDGALVEAFFEELKNNRHISANTEAAYRTDLRKLYAFAAKEQISKAAGMDVSFFEQLKSAAEIRAMRPASLERFRSCVHSYFDYLTACREIPLNCADHFDPQACREKTEKKEEGILSIAELSRLLEAPDLSLWHGRRDSALLELMYAAGLKAGEVILLKREDVDLQVDFVTVGARTVPFGSRARTALIRFLKAGAMQNEDPQGFLFTARNGKPLTRQQVWKIIRKYALKAGLKSGISPNCIRRSFAAHVLENGMDDESLRQLLGLRSGSMVRRYRGQIQNELRELYRRSNRLEP